MVNKLLKVDLKILLLLFFWGLISSNCFAQRTGYDAATYNLLLTNKESLKQMLENDPTMVVNLRGADLSNMDLSGFRFGESDFAYANLTNANLKEADCRGANFIGAKLMGANLAAANVSNANFDRSNVTGANFRDAVIQGAEMDNMGIQVQRSSIVPATLLNGVVIPKTK